MTPAELQAILADIVTQLSDIVSLALGGLTGLAFVLASSQKWR